MAPPLPAALDPSRHLDHTPERHSLDLSTCERPTNAARSQIREALADRTDQEKVDDVVLVVDELVVNALTHTPGVGLLLLEVRRDQARVSVYDGGGNCADVAVKSAEKSDQNGRGLAIVAKLTEEWFAKPAPAGGKAVVAVFALAPPENNSR